MNGNNKGETIRIKKVGARWYKIYPYWQTRWNRVKKTKAVEEIEHSFKQGRNMPSFGYISFEAEKEKMKERVYHYEYWDDKPN